MASQSGVRVRLDLSNVETNVKKQFRWIYLSHESFSTIKDVKNYIRTCLADQSDPKPQIRLYLEEPFWLPASESVRILQNGDLIVVKKRGCEADGETTTTTTTTTSTRKRHLSATPTSERRSEVDTVVSKSLSLPKKQRFESNGKTEAKVQKKKVVKREKASTDESSSSDSETDADAKKPEPPKPSKSVPKKSNSSESSDSESSDNDADEKVSASKQTELKKENPKPAEAASPAAGTRTPNPAASVEKKTKKRKRKRQPKNKNKLPASEVNKVPVPDVPAQVVMPSDPPPKPVGSNLVLTNSFGQRGKKPWAINQTSKHIFFQDEPMDVAPEPEASPARPVSQPEVHPTEARSLPVAPPLKSVSLDDYLPASNKPAESLSPSPANVSSSYQVQRSRLVPNSGDISCEQALLGEITSLQAVRNSPRLSNGSSSSPARSQNGHLASVKLPTNQDRLRQGQASGSAGQSLANLLSLAQAGNTLRGSRQRRPDVWSNRSVVLENTEDPTPTTTEPNKSAAPRDFSKYQLLSQPPDVGSVIAFKFLHLSANYTPEFSEYLGGKVLDVGPDSIDVQISFDENVDDEPRNTKFEIEEKSGGNSNVGSTLSLKWQDLIEPRKLDD